MVISHKYKFIFVKTVKTAGTSIEIFLSQHCGENDILTPITPHVYPHVARNYKGFSNPITDIILKRGRGIKNTFRQWVHLNKYYSHMPARIIRRRVSPQVWNSYFKFCVERNPWDKTISHYYMIKHRSGGTLTLEDYFKKGSFCINYPKYIDDKGNLLVDKVVKFENLEKELDVIFKHIEVPFAGELGVKAKSEYRKNRKPYREVLLKEQKELIDRVFRKEIFMHSYTF